MSFTGLPKEIRLQIWTLAYFAEPPRLVALRTKPHDESHDEKWFCPRYSPSPAPMVVNICHEARAEAYYQARKAGHVIRHHIGPLFVPPQQLAQFTEEYYFRFDADTLYLPLEDQHVKHFDDSPEVGLLSHFHKAVNLDTSKLQSIAITRVIWCGYHDGSLSNTLRDFASISRLIMMVPEEVEQDEARKALFVRASRRIASLYRFDSANRSPELTQLIAISVDFARLERGQLAILPKHTWEHWSSLGSTWTVMDGPEQFYESMSGV
ncbi:hypothetical protein CC86DRAFT_391380 [Ophiobolus disseminans]|uniref:2EXR domain-containing protein n=1 Tax=Ophiobolus disseminans TaxID=1469910 RepID=A0A6A7AAY2_9PLEO|nr:hypothetical protein CC86DRAFT_391380 [Ophiobolus disseminans]